MALYFAPVISIYLKELYTVECTTLANPMYSMNSALAVNTKHTLTVIYENDIAIVMNSITSNEQSLMMYFNPTFRTYFTQVGRAFSVLLSHSTHEGWLR
jgi:hypothetical protein